MMAATTIAARARRPAYWQTAASPGDKASRIWPTRYGHEQIKIHDVLLNGF